MKSFVSIQDLSATPQASTLRVAAPFLSILPLAKLMYVIPVFRSFKLYVVLNNLFIVGNKVRLLSRRSKISLDHV